ncbi:bacteriohemerythrin [Inediibacterium massiliense]|uniref:bacteriohemerythrin n=1 Tax=Inediibacterium massiliense TaxID=1658111 RepID=UPI0006B4C9EB|nr:bacteriohemerythrin [Inediibacterium massiliense]
MFEWRDEYSCEVGEIDKQHRQLLQIGSKLYGILTLKDSEDRYDEIMEVLHELSDYTVYHFDYEEKLMEQHGYENIKSHKRQHKSFVNKVIQLQNQDIEEKQKRITLEMIKFIADWIENHILVTDHKYKEFFHEKGVY